MANEKQIALLRQGAKVWNAWRTLRPGEPLDLSGAMLSGENLANSDLHGVDFTDGYFEDTNLTGSNLDHANLTRATLVIANLTKASLNKTDFSHVSLGDTVFADVDLSEAMSLNTCRHWTGSIIDIRTLTRSRKLPIRFLRGVGLSNDIIEHRELFKPSSYYSCFISHSTKDQAFVEKLYADLEKEDVRCWRNDFPIGASILATIYEMILRRDKLLLVLSKAAIASPWVKVEVMKAYDVERKRRIPMIFPIRIDDTAMDTKEPWACELRERHIGDFREWAKPSEYRNSLGKLLGVLKMPAAGPPLS